MTICSCVYCVCVFGTQPSVCQRIWRVVLPPQYELSLIFCWPSSAISVHRILFLWHRQASRDIYCSLSSRPVPLMVTHRFSIVPLQNSYPIRCYCTTRRCYPIFHLKYHIFKLPKFHVSLQNTNFDFLVRDNICLTLNGVFPLLGNPCGLIDFLLNNDWDVMREKGATS